MGRWSGDGRGWGVGRPCLKDGDVYGLACGSFRFALFAFALSFLNPDYGTLRVVCSVRSFRFAYTLVLSLEVVES